MIFTIIFSNLSSQAGLVGSQKPLYVAQFHYAPDFLQSRPGTNVEDAIGSPLGMPTLIGAIWISQGATRIDSCGTRVDPGRPRWCPQPWCPLIFFSHEEAPRWGPQQWCPLIFDARKEAPVVVPTRVVPTNLRIVFDVFNSKISGHQSSGHRQNALRENP